MAPKRIRIETFPNRDFRKFHVTAPISKATTLAYYGTVHQDLFANEHEKTLLSEEVQHLINELNAIDGVVSAGVGLNHVEIIKATAYDWSDFENEVIDSIKAFLAWWDDDEVSVQATEETAFHVTLLSELMKQWENQRPVDEVCDALNLDTPVDNAE